MQNITSKNFVELLNAHGIKNYRIININFGKEKYFQKNEINNENESEMKQCNE